MKNLGRDVTRLILKKYLSGYDAIKCIKLSRYMYRLLSEREKEEIRMKCKMFVDRKKQSDYIHLLLETKTQKAHEANRVRISKGKRPKKVKYDFCYNCANIIRVGVHRLENHKPHCQRLFSPCVHCKMPLSNSFHVSCMYSLAKGHIMNDCPYKKKKKVHVIKNNKVL